MAKRQKRSDEKKRRHYVLLSPSGEGSSNLPRCRFAKITSRCSRRRLSPCRRYHPLDASEVSSRPIAAGRNIQPYKVPGALPVTTALEIVLGMMLDIAASRSNLVTEGMLRARLIEPCRWLQLQQLFIIRRGRYRFVGAMFICFVRQYKASTIQNLCSIVECFISEIVFFRGLIVI